MSIATTARRVLGRQPDAVPTFDQPIPTDARELTFLGERRGHRHYTHPRYPAAEFVEGRLVHESIVPAGLMLRGSEAGTWIPLRAVPAGTFAAPAKLPAAPKVRPHRPIDALARLPAFAGSPARFLDLGRDRTDSLMQPVSRADAADLDGLPLPMSPLPAALMVGGAPAARGPGAIITRVTKRGVKLSLTASGGLLVTSPGGRLSDGELQAIREAERLIAAYLAGTPLPCELAHDGTAPGAVTLAAVDVAVCSDHLTSLDA